MKIQSKTMHELNGHNKKEYPPMHTAEHILNQTMIRMFGCERSKNAHIERKKSKCDYYLSAAPTQEDIENIEKQVNTVIAQNLPVTYELMNIHDAKSILDLSKLPDDVSETLRVVKVGTYDICACIGDHVENTSEIGRFKISSYNFESNRLRIRFKLEK